MKDRQQKIRGQLQKVNPQKLKQGLAVCGVILCAAIVSRALDFAGTAGMLLLAAGAFWLYSREQAAPGTKRMRIWCGIYAVLFSWAFMVGRLVHGGINAKEATTINYIDTPSALNVLMALALPVLLWPLFMAVARVLAVHPVTADKKPIQRCFFVAWVAIFVCWLPYMAAFYPAGMVGDGAISLESALTPGIPASNHFCVAYILFLRLLVWVARLFGADLMGALFLYAILQSLALSAVCAAVVCKVYSTSLPWWAAMACTLLYALSGFFASYGTVMWKDTLFSAAIVLLVLLLWQFAEKGATPKLAVQFFCVTVFFCFWRNNGIYILVGVLLFLLIGWRRSAKFLLMAGGAALVVVLLVQGPVYDALNIDKDSLKESLSVPLQQLAFTIHEERPLTEEQEEVLFSVLPQEKWKENYEPCLSDDIKGKVNTKYLSAHLGEFFKVWAQLLPGNFDLYVKAYLMDSLGFWQMGSYIGFYHDYFVGTDDIFGRGIVTVDCIEAVTGHSLQGLLRGFARFISSGTMVWVMFGVTALCLGQGKGRRKMPLLVLSPLLLSWFSVAVATPIAHSYRYIFMLPLALPLLCLLTVYQWQTPLAPASAVAAEPAADRQESPENPENKISEK